MITQTREEAERERKYQDRLRAEALRMVFGNGVTFKVTDDGVLTVRRGHRVLATKELSTDFLEKVAWKVKDEMRGGQ